LPSTEKWILDFAELVGESGSHKQGFSRILPGIAADGKPDQMPAPTPPAAPGRRPATEAEADRGGAGGYQERIEGAHQKRARAYCTPCNAASCRWDVRSPSPRAAVRSPSSTPLTPAPPPGPKLPLFCRSATPSLEGFVDNTGRRRGSYLKGKKGRRRG